MNKTIDFRPSEVVFFFEESIFMTSKVMSRMAQYIAQQCHDDWDEVVAIEPFIDWLVRQKVINDFPAAREEIRNTIHSLVVGQYLFNTDKGVVVGGKMLSDFLNRPGVVKHKPGSWFGWLWETVAGETKAHHHDPSLFVTRRL